VRLIFCGTPEFAAIQLRALLAGPHEVAVVISRPPQRKGRGLQEEDPPVVLVAREAGLPVRQPVKLHAPDFLEELRSFGADLLITAAFGRILRPSLLSLPPRGCWNVHASLLPRHRGASPISAAILAGDLWTGVTLFRLDEGLDTGPMLWQEMTPIGPAETTGTLSARLAEMGGGLLRRALDLEARGENTLRPQPPWGATYAPLLAKEDGIVPWNRPVEQVERMIRAVNPWPGAWSMALGKRLRIHRASPLHGLATPTIPIAPEFGTEPRENRLNFAERTEEPGTVVWTPQGVGVTCGPGLLLLHEVQFEGGKRMEATTWFRGSRVPVGTRLTNPA
jgi:methionyl-tRNA formyltransferase